MTFFKNALVAAALLAGMTVGAHAATYQFSFSNEEGLIPGDVIGLIVLPDGDGVQAATTVIVTSAPTALGTYWQGLNFATAPAPRGTNEFTVVGGRLTDIAFSVTPTSGGRLAMFNASGRPIAALESQFDTRAQSGVYDGGANTLRPNAAFPGAALSADVPLPAAAPLVVIGLGALLVAGRRRRA